MEKILAYSRAAVGAYDGVVQQKPWDCGPASAQIILQACGINVSEDQLIAEIGTTTLGTNSAELICPILNKYLPGSGYKAVWLSREPVSQAQIEQLWKDIVRSIDSGRGVILNFEAPPGRGPRGTRGSVSPNYSAWSTTYHYTAGMGYVTDPDGSRHIWVADPGFPPITGYWCSLEDVARLIVPHAYGVATSAPIVQPPKPAPAPIPAPVTDPVAALTAKVDQLLAAYTRLLSIIEKQHPETLQAYLDAA